MFCPGEEGKGSQNRWLTRTRESPPARTQAHGHVGPATPSASRQPADPFLFIYPRPPGPRTPAHTPQRSPHTRGSRKRFRFRFRRGVTLLLRPPDASREREVGMAAAVVDDAGMDAVQKRLMFEDE